MSMLLLLSKLTGSICALDQSKHGPEGHGIIQDMLGSVNAFLRTAASRDVKALSEMYQLQWLLASPAAIQLETDKVGSSGKYEDLEEKMSALCQVPHAFRTVLHIELVYFLLMCFRSTVEVLKETDPPVGP